MATARSVRMTPPRRRSPARTNLLPPGAELVIRRRLREVFGFLSLTLGFCVIVALVTYDSADPSFNTATVGSVRNVLGLPGAYTADMLLQAFGFTAAVLPVTLCGWGIRWMMGRKLKGTIFRLALMPLSWFLIAGAFSLFSAPPDLPTDSMGGAVGQLILARGGVAARFLPYSLGGPTIALISGILGFVFLLITLGFSAGEWFGAIARFFRLVTRTLTTIFRGVGFMSGIGIRMVNAVVHRRGARSLEAGDTDPRLSRTAIDQPRALPDQQSSPSPKLFGSDKAKKPSRVQPRSDVKRPASTAETLDLLSHDDFKLPPLELLAAPAASHAAARGTDTEGLEANARLLEGVLSEFGVNGQIVKVRPGPVVALYELEPAPGTKSSRVIGLADDIARSMSAVSVRIAVVPGRNVIGIELPNQQRETVHLRELMADPSFTKSGARLPLALGKDIGGAPAVADLTKMPHLLVAGTTGSGKSVAVNAMILSLLYRLGPDQCRFVMIDPKMLELSVYNDIPHLLTPVVTEPKKAVAALKWTVREMEDRYRAMSKVGVRNIDSYNQRLAEARAKGEIILRKIQTGFDPDTGKPVFEDQPLDLAPLPYIVVVVDEMADLMLVAGKDIEATVQRLAQMARAAGIHLIMATQRPSVDVITGTIKANFPTRISFQVTSKIDSRTILGEQGAEQLLGQGDMLYMSGGGRIARVHGPFVRDEDVVEVVKFLKSQAEPAYIESITEEDGTLDDGATMGALGTAGGSGGADDDLYRQAVDLVLRERKASTSFVQRHLQIGYNRAARLIERMENEGVVSAANHVGKRDVLARGDT